MTVSIAPPAELVDAFQLLARVLAYGDGLPFRARARHALSLAADLLGYEAGLLSRVEGGTYTVVASHGPEAALPPGAVHRLGETFCGLALDAGDLVEIRHAECSPHRGHPARAALGAESYVGTPVRVGDEVWGTLSFWSRAPRPAPLEPAHHAVIGLLAVWAGGVLAGQRREQDASDHYSRLLTVIDNAPLVLFGTDAAGRFTLSEGAGLADLGLAPGEVVGQSVFDLYAGQAGIVEAIRAVLAGSPQTWPSTLQGRHYVTQANPVLDAEGAVTGVIGISLDLTERRRAEAAAQASLERFRAVTESAGDAIVTTDARGVITSWNAAAARTFGYTAEAAVGHPVTLLLPEHYHAAFDDGLARLLAGEPPHVIGRTVRLDGRRASGEVFPMDASLSSWGAGAETEFSAILRDVSEIVSREQALLESEERFRALSAATFEGIAYSRGGEVIDCNEQFAWLFGYARIGDVIGQQLARFCAPEYVERVAESIRADWTGTSEIVCVRRDGSRFWAELQGRSAPVDGEAVWITAIRDVTVRKRVEEQRRFQADVLAHVSDAVVALDHEGRVTYWNAGAEALHGQNANAVLGRRLEEVVTYLLPGPLEDVYAESDSPEAALQSAAAEAGELIYVAPDGSRRFVSVSSSVLRDEDGAERGLLAVARDVTAQRQMAARLKHQALHDVLTGLPNRALFRQRIEKALDRGTPFAVLFVDLDHFKVVNDSLGHDAGDLLLTTIARRIREVLGAFEGSLVARLGGDEFGVFTPTTESGPEALGHAVLRALDEPVDLGARPVTPSASVGLVPFADRYRTPDELLRDADTAMYAAKRAGRRQLVVFDQAMHDAANLRFGLEHDLRHAIERGQLAVHLQPVLDLADGHVVGFEARVRWDHPDRGLLPAGDFLPLAEEIGAVHDVDRWVLETASAAAGPWLAEAGLFLSVHCSGPTFLDPGLADRARRASEAAGLPAGSLILELPEAALADDAAARQTLAALREVGIRVEVDNFGAGASSLRLLHMLPVDGLKIDRSFVADLSSRPTHAIARAVIGLAADLGLDAIADGIETADQLRDLRALGARFGQGYLFSRPMPTDEARALLASPPWRGAWASWLSA